MKMMNGMNLNGLPVCMECEDKIKVFGGNFMLNEVLTEVLKVGYNIDHIVPVEDGNIIVLI